MYICIYTHHARQKIICNSVKTYILLKEKVLESL